MKVRNAAYACGPDWGRLPAALKRAIVLTADMSRGLAARSLALSQAQQWYRRNPAPCPVIPPGRETAYVDRSCRLSRGHGGDHDFPPRGGESNDGKGPTEVTAGRQH